MTYRGPPIPLFFLLPTPPTDTNPAANSVVEGAVVNTQVGITASSTDFLGLPITYSLGSDSSGGGFKIDPTTGVVTVADPTKINFETAPGHVYTITAQASDFFGLLTNTQTFTIAVTDVAPSTPVDANAAANSVAEGAANGTAVGITASSTDVNGPAVTYSLTADSSGGGFTVNSTTGVVTVADSSKIDYETSPGHAYTVTVRASDGTLTSSQTFSIGVTDVPLPVPVDSNAAANSVAEGAAAGTTVGLTATAVDPNGPTTVYSLTGDTSGGGFTINSSTGVVTVADPTKIDFESAAGHAYTVTVKADDGLASTTQSFSIAVSDVAPSTPVDSNAAANTVAEGAANGSTVGVTASSTDINGPAVTYSLTGDTSSGGFTINAATGVVTVADAAKIDYETAAGHAYTVTARASDGTLTSSQTFTIAVTDVAPSTPTDSNAAANSVAEGAANGSTVGVTASSTDVNGPAVTYSLTGDTSGGGFTINAATGVVTVADATKIDFETAAGHVYTVTAQASDGTLTSSQTFTIGVTDVAPSTPVDSNAAANTVAEGAVNGSNVGVTASSTDVNGPAVTYSLTGDSSGGGFTINSSTGVVTVADSTKIDYESAAGHAYTVTAQASDGTLTSSQTFAIAVTDVAPSTPTDSNAAANTVAEGAANGSTVGVTASSTDVNGPAVTYSLTGDTSGGGFTINAATGVITVADATKIDYETAAGHAYTVTAQASDGILTSSQAFVIGVTDVAPSTPTDSNAAANSVAEGAANGSTVGVTASSTDVNGPAVTYSLTGDTSGGGFTINAVTGVITVADATKIDYETAAGHAYTVTAQASDGTLTSSQTFTIGVTDVAPSTPTDSNAAANSVAEGAANGSAVGVTASSTDVNGPAVTYSLTGDTSGGGFTINSSTGVVTVADATKIDFESSGGSYTVTAQASDGTLTSSQTFTIAVTDVAPSTPVDSNAAANSVAEGAANGSTVGVTASSTDVNGPAVTYSLTGDSSGGGFTINAATGVVTVADATKIDFESSGGSYTVTAQASDGTLTSSQTFAIAVTDVAPSTPTDSNAAANTVAEGAANGSTVGVTASSTDVNGPAVTYSLTGDTSGGGFTINAATGVITVADATKIDYETAAGHAYTVTAQASDGTLASSQTFTIGVTDVAPSTPVDSDAAGNSVAEGAANGSSVGVTAFSTDVNGPAVTYSLTGDTSGGGFTINAATGVVTVADSTKIDYESSGAGHSYTVTAQASDGTLTSSQAFVIAVSDVAPSTPVDSDAATNQISQNAPVGTHTGVTASSTDVNGPAVTYSLTGDSSGGGFTINPTTGVVTVADPTKVIYNAGSPTYTVTVDASDGTLHSQQTFTINVLLDTPPVANDDSVSATEAGGINNAVAGVNPSGNVILGTGAPGNVQDTDAEDPSSALVAVAVHTGPKGAPVTAGTIGSPLAGDHGTLTLNANGAYTYSVNQTDAQVQALHSSADTITDVFDYTIQDTGGLQSTATLTVTIHGADDLPQAVADTGTMTEDDAPTSFNVISNDTQDPDQSATNAITVGPGGITVTGPAGETFANTDATASIVSNQVQVTLTNSHFQQLTVGEHATVTVPYTLTGDTGETSTANLVVTVNGVNDVPVAVDDAASMTEDSVGAASTFTVLGNDTLDPDHGAPNNVTTGSVTNLVAPSGENIDVTDIGVSVNGSNQIVVTLGSDFQHMQDGQTATFDIPYTLHGDQPGDSSTATLHVTVNGANDAPTASNFTFSGVNSATANTDLVVDGPGAGTPDPAGPQKTISGDLLGGASDIDGPGPLVVVAGTITTAHSGTVTMLSNGDFTYKPAVGYTGADSFTYTVSDQNPGVAGTANGTVNLNVIAPKVWYVNADAGTDGDGSSEHPFNTLSHFAGGGGVDGAGDTIFLETSSAHYTGGLTLENNEQLISQSAGLVVPDGGVGAGTVTLVAASGANAVVDGGVVLGSGDTIQGVDFGTNGTFALSGSSVGTVHVDDVTSGVINNASGGGVSIGGSSNVLHMDFSSITTGGGTSGISLAGSSGTFHAHGGTLSNASGAEVALSGGTFNFTDDGAINNTNGTNVSISNMNSTIDFNGAITGHGIALSSNTGSTMSFDGGMTLSTGASNAFSATGGGTLTVTGTNHLTTTTGTALNIANTTIGSSNVTFHDINANGAVNGIVLNNTGSSGHLVVTGSGSGSTALGGDSSGGTIQNTTGQAVSLTNTNGPSFTNLNIHDSALSGINGTQVTNFTLANSAITNVNTAHNTTDGDVTFNLSAGGSTENNLSGAVSITGNTLNNSWQDGISINNYVGTISSLTITGNSLTSVSTLQSGSAGTAIKVLAQQENGSTAAQITAGTISDNTINNFPGGGGIIVHGGSTSALAAVNIGSSANHFKIDGNTITGAGTGLAGIGTNGIEVTMGDLSNGYFNIGEAGQGNTITNVAGDGIAGSLFGTGTALYDIGYNTIDAHNTSNSPGINTGADSAVSASDTPTLYLNIHNNTVSNTTGNGIISTIRGANGTGYFKIDNNTVNQPIQGTTAYGIRVDSGNGTEATGATVILEIQGNTTTGGKNGSGTIQAPGIGLRDNHLSGSTGTFEIVGLTPTPANDAQMEAYVGNGGQNPGSANGTFGATGVASISSGATFTAGTLPAFPLLAADGGVPASSPTTGEMNLTQSELDSVVAAAIAQWAAAGASASQLAALHATTFSVADLSGATIGEESSPAHVTIDINADGHGWFVDPTPSDNSEFAHAQNAAGTDLLTDPTNAAAGHLDLLTTVTHELGHVLGLADSTAAADVNDLMYINLVDGERRLPDTADVTQANANVAQTGASLAQASEAALPASAQAHGGAPIVVGTAGNDTIDAGFGGKILFGGAGADNFVFGHDIVLSTPSAPSAQPITHVADYSAAQGDTFDFSALTSAFHASDIADASLVRAVEDRSGSFATLQLGTNKDNATWVNVAQIDGAHSGDAVNVLVDSHSAVHLAHLHVDLLV